MLAIHDQCKTVDEFKAQLKEVGAGFPDSFVENMDRIILTMHPKHKKKPAAGSDKDAGAPVDKQRRMFPGLAMPDADPKQLDANAKEVDALMSELDGLSKRARPKAADLMDDEPASKRPRVERDISPPRRRRSRSRSRSPPRRDRDRDAGRYDDRPRGRDYGRGGGRAPVDDRPVLYKIYEGKVSGVKDFGAFVTLDGVAGRCEGTQAGLVTASSDSRTRRDGTRVEHAAGPSQLSG